MLLGSPTETSSSGARPILPLDLRNVSYHAGGRCLLDAVDQRFESGGISVILGPNGAGKSLLLRLCHGLLQPTRGDIHWAINERREVRRRQAMVFQRPVHMRRSVKANLDFALSARRIPRTERRGRVAEALERSRLAHLADRPARVLSGGEQQRLALARAWALRPDVLFLDEPTANLDPASTREVEAMILLMREAGTKVLMSTHALDQARRLAEDVLFLHGGRILERRLADGFFANPISEEARAFVEGRLLW